MEYIIFLSIVAASMALPYGALPQATSYIYRSDNNGPASLITVGPQVAPQIWAPHVPIQEPVQFVHAPIAPLPYIVHPGQEIILEDKEGNDFAEEHESAHDEAGSKGYNNHDDHDKADEAEYSDESDESHASDEESNEASHHDEVDAHGSDSEESDESEEENNGNEKHFSNGNDITGYHKVFNKEEFKKDHDFYDVADKSGHFNKHAYGNEHHGSEEGGHKKGGAHESGKEGQDFSEQDDLLKDEHDEADSGHEAEEGEEGHYHAEERHNHAGEEHQNKYHKYEPENSYEY